MATERSEGGSRGAGRSPGATAGRTDGPQRSEDRPPARTAPAARTRPRRLLASVGASRHHGSVGVSRVVQAALDAGHEPSVVHEGRRFRIVCSCGWRSSTAWNRKRTFEAVTEHVYAAGRTQLEGSSGVSQPTSEELSEVAGILGRAG